MEDINKSFSLALRYPVRSANFYNIIPFPATELFDWLKKNNYLLYSPDDILNNASHFINEPCFFTPELSREQRKDAFIQGRAVSMRIRRKYIERKVNGPLLIKKLLSYFYTMAFVERVLSNNSIIIKLKEVLKKLALK
jgi:hypothetical protein